MSRSPVLALPRSLLILFLAVTGGGDLAAQADPERAREILSLLRRGETVADGELLEEAEALRAGLDPTDQAGRLRGDLAVELSWAYREDARFELAEARAREAIDLGRSLAAPRLQADGHNALGGVFWRRGNLAAVWDQWLQALRLREAAGDRAGMAASFSNLGILLDAEGDFPGALEYYQQALAIDRAIGSEPAEIASTLNNIGALHEQMGESEAALDYHREALAIRLQVGDEREIATSNNNIGAALADLGRLAEAREALGQALTMRRRVGDRPGEASTLGELGKLERLAGDVDAAEAHARASLALYQALGEPWGQADVSNQLGEIALAAGRPAEALAHFEQARIQAEALGALLLLADQWDGRARALEALERWQEALAAARRQAALREQVAGDASRRRVELLEIRHDTQRRELEVARLRAANASAAQALAQARFERRAIVLGAGGLVVFVAGLAWAFRRQRRATHAAREAHDRLRLLSERKDHFLRIVAHDLRSPLGNVRWMAGLLRTGAEDPAEVKKVAGMVEDVAGRLVKTTDNLLDLDRIEAGAVRPQWETVNLADVIHRVVEQRRGAAEAKQQELRVVGPRTRRAVSSAVRTDVGLAEQILDNLLSNAVKFTPAGGVIEVRWLRSAEALRVSVADSGPGISDEGRAILFSRFAQVGNRPTAGEETHGLGLAIAHGLAQAIGARLSLEPAADQLGGARFAVCFPLKSDADQTVADGEVGE